MNFKKILNVSLVMIIVINIFFSSWYVLTGDIIFHTDIARDFLILNEISQKKLILIGPRASGIEGAFHGPLWAYINYLPWVLGNGNPINQGVFWVFLNILFLVSTYLITRKLFTDSVAVISISLLSFSMIDITKMMHNPHGAMMLIPLFIYLFIQYLDKKKNIFLILMLLTLGCITQFQMATGPALIILAAIPIIISIIKNKNYIHFISFLFLVIPLLSWIIFDLRHQFLISKALINYFTYTKRSNFTYSQIFSDRLNKMLFSGLFLANGTYEWLNIVMSYFITIVSFVIIRVRNLKFKNYFIYLLYFYIGFWIISLAHHGLALWQHYIAILPLSIMIFSATYLFTNKKIFAILFSLLIIANYIWVFDIVKLSYTFSTKDETSWKRQWDVANKVFVDAGNKNFGYFIFSPDVVGYSPKYAMIYGQRVYKNIIASAFQKKPLTYLIIAPPPANRPYLNDIYWKSDQIKIKSKPIETFTFPNGYRVEKYRLKEAEINKSPDPFLNKGIEIR